MKNKRKRIALKIRELRRALRKLRAKYHLEEVITCKICGEEFQSLAAHIRTHDINNQTYRRKFGVSYLTSDSLRLKQRRFKERLIGQAEIIWLRRHWDQHFLNLKQTANMLGVDGKYLHAWCRKLKLPLIPHKKWNEKLVLRVMRKRMRRKQSVRTKDIFKENRSLFNAVEWYFGSWRSLFAHMGINYAEEIRKYWNKRRIIKALKKLHRQGLPMDTYALDENNHRLYAAIKWEFDNWGNAITAAGINPKDVSAVNYWSKKSVIKGLKKLAKQFKSSKMSIKEARKINSVLVSGAVSPKNFGSWNKAMRAAGLKQHINRSPKRWTEERIIKRIKKDFRRGMPINYKAMQKRRSWFTTAAKAHFGSYEKAVKAAGFNYDKICLHKRAG